MEKPLKQKKYVCLRCGKRFLGRQDRCPRCAQLIVYQVKDRYFNALGDELILTKDKKHIAKVIPNDKKPQ